MSGYFASGGVAEGRPAWLHRERRGRPQPSHGYVERARLKREIAIAEAQIEAAGR
jgi:hypothetical protein